MSRHEATFDIDSRADAEAVRLLAERIYDDLREETRESEGSGLREMLEASGPSGRRPAALGRVR